LDGETIIQLVTIVATLITTIVTLLVRARLAEQGKDIKELKADAQKKDQS